MPDTAPLNIAGQIALLASRGLDVPDEHARIALGRLLTDHGYSRLSRYWRYQQRGPHSGDKTFQPGTTVVDLAAAYRFDSALRRVLAEGLEDFEVALRGRLGYFMAITGGAYVYRERSAYRALSRQDGGDAREDLLDAIGREIERSNEEFIASAVAGGGVPPVWDAIEALSLGSVSRMYSLFTDERVRRSVAGSFGYPHARFAESAFRAMVVVRNVCAHHAKVWQRVNIQVPPPVLNRLKTDPDPAVYQSTPWAWLVVLADLVDTIRRGDGYSAALWALVDAHPQYVDGLKRPRSA
jgi:abortive infection bacteriophage resistance protein